MSKKARSRETAEQHLRSIRRATRKQYLAEEKIRIVLDGLRGEQSIAELCRREGIAQGLYYSGPKEFFEAGTRRLSGDTSRKATFDKVKSLRREASDLKEVLAERLLENRLLKKAWSGVGKAKDEISRVGKAGDYPPGRAVTAVGGTHPGHAGGVEADVSMSLIFYSSVTQPSDAFFTVLM